MKLGSILPELLFPFAAGAQTPQIDQLNPALRLDRDAAVKLFDLGYERANRDRDDSGVVNRLRRGIGGIRINKIGTKETVSYLWAEPLAYQVYNLGFMARKKYTASDVVDRQKATLGQGLSFEHPALQFFGRLRILPSFAGGYGSVNRRANESDLDDVHVVLKVGDKIYQPFAQPGHAETSRGTNTNTFETPETVTSTATATASGSGGWARAYATSTTTFNVTHAQNYEWYQAEFNVAFSLFNDDGTARITPADKEVEVIVVYGPNERHAKYNVEDFLVK